jgi:hypothetical protein
MNKQGSGGSTSTNTVCLHRVLDERSMSRI